MIALLLAAVVGLDHVPLAVRDLRAAGDDFRRLGFTLKPGRHHDDGIENLHAKFRDATEIELITAPAARDDLTRFYVEHLRQGDGPAFLALFAPSDAPPDPGLRYLFFGRRNASPTDRPEHFEHANGADGLIAVWLATDGPEARLFGSWGAKLSKRNVAVPEMEPATVAAFPQGEVVLMPASRQVVPGRPILGAVLRVRDLAASRKALSGAKVVEKGRSLFFFTHGLWLELREQR